jgi:hypothetical protein
MASVREEIGDIRGRILKCGAAGGLAVLAAALAVGVANGKPRVNEGVGEVKLALDPKAVIRAVGAKPANVHRNANGATTSLGFAGPEAGQDTTVIFDSRERAAEIVTYNPGEAFAGWDPAVRGSSFTAAVVRVGDKELVLTVARGDRLACDPGERENDGTRSGVGMDLARRDRPIAGKVRPEVGRRRRAWVRCDGSEGEAVLLGGDHAHADGRGDVGLGHVGLLRGDVADVAAVVQALQRQGVMRQRRAVAGGCVAVGDRCDQADREAHCGAGGAAGVVALGAADRRVDGLDDQVRAVRAVGACRGGTAASGTPAGTSPPPARPKAHRPGGGADTGAPGRSGGRTAGRSSPAGQSSVAGRSRRAPNSSLHRLPSTPRVTPRRQPVRRSTSKWALIERPNGPATGTAAPPSSARCPPGFALGRRAAVADRPSEASGEQRFNRLDRRFGKAYRGVAERLFVRLTKTLDGPQ